MEMKIGVEKNLWYCLDLLRKSPNYQRMSEGFLLVLHLYYEKIIDREFVGADKKEHLQQIFGNIDRRYDQSVSALLLSVINIFNEEFLAFMDSDSDIVEYLFEMDFEEFSNQYPAMFDRVLQRIESLESKRGGEYFQPVEMTQLIHAICPVASGAMVYNPFAGVGSYGVALDAQTEYWAQELNQRVWALGVLRLMAYDIDPSHYFCADSLKEWHPDHQKFDYILSTPPLGLRLPKHGPYRDISIASTAEEFVLEQGSKGLTEQGKLLQVCTRSLLFGQGRSAEIRKKLIDEDLVEMVVALPTNLLPSTAISMSIIILSKQKQEKGAVKFIDGLSFLIRNRGSHNLLNVGDLVLKIESLDEQVVRWVSNDQIAQNDYVLSPEVYFQEEIPVPLGFVSLALKELLSPAPLSREFKETDGYFASISDLAGEDGPFEKNSQDFPLSHDLKYGRKLTTPALLLSAVRSLKPTYCYASEQAPLFVGNNIWAYTLNNPNIHVGYLCQQLAKIGMVGVGTLIPHISRSRIENLHVPFPPLDSASCVDEQKSVFQHENQLAKLAKAKELGLQEMIEEMKAEYINEVRMRKHDMRPHLRNLSSIEHLFRYYLAHTDSETFVDDMALQINCMHESLGYLSELVDRLSEESKFGSPEIINLDEYLTYLVSHHSNGEGYVLEMGCDDIALKENGFMISVEDSELFEPVLEEQKANESYTPNPWFVRIAKSDLDRLVHNILENARTHGFTDRERTDYHLEVYVSIDTQRNMFRIDFINNGTPWPEGIDKERYGLRGEKGGTTGGSGVGGYLVKEIVKHYGGDYDIFMDEQNKTVVRILLPVDFE